jgi:hypothetical protein
MNKKPMLQGYNESRLKSPFRKFYGHFIMTLSAITGYWSFVDFFFPYPLIDHHVHTNFDNG